MHMICELVMPPTSDIAGAVADVMKQFQDTEEYPHQWHDFYAIGGRFGGHKVTSVLDGTTLAEFYAELKRLKITVHGLQFGKQEISTPEQEELVDAAWATFFPSIGGRCPLFKHGTRDQYDKGQPDPMDVCTVANLHPDLKAERVVVVVPDGDGLRPHYMVSADQWNGVIHQKSAWDGKVSSALREADERLSVYRPEYAAKRRVGPDWLVVTIDYHN